MVPVGSGIKIELASPVVVMVIVEVPSISSGSDVGDIV
jgi:hypothetical protein